MNLNAFGNAPQGNILLHLDIASGVSQVAAAALDQLFKTACPALQASLYLMAHAIVENAQQLHILPILNSVFANNVSSDAIFALHLTSAVIASQDTAYMRAGAIKSVLVTHTLNVIDF
jgi:hypothetical protein